MKSRKMVPMNLFAGQQWRHRDSKQTCRFVRWGRERVGQLWQSQPACSVSQGLTRGAAGGTAGRQILAHDKECFLTVATGHVLLTLYLHAWHWHGSE